MTQCLEFRIKSVFPNAPLFVKHKILTSFTQLQQGSCPINSRPLFFNSEAWRPHGFRDGLGHGAASESSVVFRFSVLCVVPRCSETMVNLLFLCWMGSRLPEKPTV